MRELADGVWQLDGRPKNTINAYLLGDVLIDAGMFYDARSILRQIEDREISALALTHAHIDHVGSAHAICAARGIPFWAGEQDVKAAETGKMEMRLPGLGIRHIPHAKGHQVARALREGDEVAGFKVLSTPGHSPGHVSYWREDDRVLVCGDVMWGFNPFMMRGPIREPFAAFSTDPRQNRESARRLAALNPELVLFGHGEPLAGDPERFTAAVERLAG